MDTGNLTEQLAEAMGIDWNTLDQRQRARVFELIDNHRQHCLIEGTKRAVQTTERRYYVVTLMSAHYEFREALAIVDKIFQEVS